MSSRLLIKIITGLVFAVVILVPLFFLKEGIYPFLFDKAMFFQTIVEVLFALWLVLAIIDSRYRPKKTPLTLSLAGFAAALVLTAFLGIDPWRSFFSTYERAFGVFGLLHMAALTLVISSMYKELPWKRIFSASLITSVFIGILSGIELYYDSSLLIIQPLTRSGATFGNPTFFAGYLSWNIFLAIYFFFRSFFASGENFSPNGNSKKNGGSFSKFFSSKLWFAFVAIFDAYALVFITQTRGNILGLAAGFFALVLMFAARPPNFSGNKFLETLSSRKIYVGISFFVIFAGLVFWFTRGSDTWSKFPGLGRFRNVSFVAEDLQPRLIAARAAWQGFLERPLFGIGPENFNIVFNKYYDPKALRVNYQETRFDKPHNFVLEDLTSGGIVLFLARFLFLALFLYEAWKYKEKLFGQFLVAATVSYAVANLFIFDTIGSNLLLYVLAGFVDGAYRSEMADRKPQTINGATAPQTRKKNDARVSLSLFAMALSTSLLFAYFFNISSILASRRTFFAFYDVARGIDTDRSRLSKGIDEFRAAVSTWSPYSWNFARDFAASMSETYFYNPQVIPKDAVLEAIGDMEKVASEHPDDAYNHYALVDMYNQISDIDPSRFIPAAEREAAIALKLSPKRQEIYFSLAKTKTLENDYASALGLVRYALSLDDQVADSHFYYGLISFAANDYATGYREIKRALELGRRWTSFYEPLTVGNQFAEAGHLEEAIVFYETAVKMASAELEPRTKLGIAYYFAGRLEDAKRELEEVGKVFDFKKSLQFENLKPILDNLKIVY